MKTIYTLIISLFALSLLSQPRCNIDELVFPEFEQAAITLWKSNADRTSINAKLNKLKMQWEQTKTSYPFGKKEIIELINFETAIDQIFFLIDRSNAASNFNRVKDFAHQIILECRSLRQCLSDDVLSLDLIWNMDDLFHEISTTVEDPMFGLYEWEEFEGMVNELSLYWTDYTHMDDEQIAGFYPKLDFGLHSKQKEKVNKCLEDFINSLESGFQDDFKLPCNELGNALKELIALYML